MGQAARHNPFNRWRTAEGDLSQFKLYDRFGREVGAGDVVYLMEKRDAMWKVEEIKPVLDPQAPPRLLQITLTSIIVAPLSGGVPTGDILKVMDVEEAAPLLNPEVEKIRREVLGREGLDRQKEKP